MSDYELNYTIMASELKKMLDEHIEKYGDKKIIFSSWSEGIWMRIQSFSYDEKKDIFSIDEEKG
jgi:hypothetical protein